MATCHYLLVGVLVLAALVNGEGDVPVVEPQSELLNGNAKMDTGVLRSHSDDKMKNPILCTACDKIVEFLKNVTDNEKLLGELVNLLLPVCDFFPYVLHEDCLATVRDVPTLVKMYADLYLNPQMDCALVCATVGLEPNTIPETVTELMKKMHNGKPNKL